MRIDAPVFGPGEFLRVDGLSALLLVLVTTVATLTLFLSPGLGRQTRYERSQLRRYHIFINLFIVAMLLAVSANNVGIMWVALEATTVFSALIIPLRLTKWSVEASWKYILIGSVGIALAFAGTVLSYFDFRGAVGPRRERLELAGTASHGSLATPGSHAHVVRVHSRWLWHESRYRTHAHLEARRLR